MDDHGGAGARPRAEDWCTAIAEDLFGEASANLPVYLFLEPERFQVIAARLGFANEPRSAFARTVAGSIRWAWGNDLWARWREATDAWIAGGKVGPPPALALLVLLTFAAENMVADAAHAAHNYYGRLAELLELDEERTERVKRAFNETVPFWQSLNDWLEDWQGERGWPTARAHDRRRFIG